MMDIYYLILVVPALLAALGAQLFVKSSYSKYSTQPADSGLTGRETAQKILAEHDLLEIRLEQTPGELTDHYDPRGGVIRLSQGVYGSTSVAAIGIAAHEVGHAIQRKQAYLPIRIRNAMLPVVQFASSAAIPLALLGFYFGQFLTTLGIVLFSATVLFQLLTLPVEFDASRRALAALSSQGILSGNDLKGAKKVLTAAALTYVASALVAVMNLLRLILLSNRRRR